MRFRCQRRTKVAINKVASRNSIGDGSGCCPVVRSAMTMSPDSGGIFDTLLQPVRFGLGGASGTGEQFVSWIHDADVIRAIEYLIAHDEIDGPVNLAAPGPIPNHELIRVLRDAWGAPIGLPATNWMLAVGLFFCGLKPN
jgi:uncharacterized protein